MDASRWLATQRQDWAQLSEGQRDRLTKLGVKPAERHVSAQAGASGAAAGTKPARTVAGLGDRLTALEREDRQYRAAGQRLVLIFVQH
jgi:hypothetical protein